MERSKWLFVLGVNIDEKSKLRRSGRGCFIGGIDGWVHGSPLASKKGRVGGESGFVGHGCSRYDGTRQENDK